VEPAPSGSTLTPEQEAIIFHVTSLQDSAYRLYARLETEMGPTAAADSVLRFFLADTGVQFAVGGDHGINVDYKSGIWGGLFLDMLDAAGGPEPPGKQLKPLPTETGARHPGAIPVPRKTVFLNPHYGTRSSYSDMLISRLNDCFPKAGYAKPGIFLDDRATVDEFASLAGSGIVHIYSHAIPRPDKDYIDEVFVMTGERLNNATTSKYWRDIEEHRIVVGKWRDGPDQYYLSPAFVTSHNDFRGDSTLIYGGFCFSFLGSWPEAMLQAGAATYTGFDWAVESNWNAYWARSLFGKMTDTSMAQPMDIQKWINEPLPPKSYYDEFDDREVHILYQGDPHTTLWTRLQITAVTPGSGLEGADVTISGTGFGATQGSSTVTFNGTPAEVSSWSDREIRTKVPTGATTGDIVVTVNEKKSNGYPFVVGADMLTDLMSLQSVYVDMWCAMTMSDGSSEWMHFEADNKPVGVDTTFPIAWSRPSFSATWKYSNHTPTPVSDSTWFSGSISGTVSADGMRIVTVTMYVETHSFSGGSLSSSTSDELVLTDVLFKSRTEGFNYLYYIVGAGVQSHVSSWSTERHYLQWDPITEETVWQTRSGVSIDWGSQEVTPEISVVFNR